MLQSYIECFCLSFLLLFKPADFCQICVKVMLSPKTNRNSFFKHKFVELFIFLQLNFKKCMMTVLVLKIQFKLYVTVFITVTVPRHSFDSVVALTTWLKSARDESVKRYLTILLLHYCRNEVIFVLAHVTNKNLALEAK